MGIYRGRNQRRMLAHLTGVEYVSCRSDPSRYNRERAEQLRKRVHALLGNKCADCGFNDWRALQIHHINNDGASDVSYATGKRLSGIKIYLRVLDKKGVGYQILCANCNYIKEFERKGYIDGSSMSRVIEVI